MTPTLTLARPSQLAPPLAQPSRDARYPRPPRSRAGAARTTARRMPPMDTDALWQLLLFVLSLLLELLAAAGRCLSNQATFVGDRCRELARLREED